MKSSKLNHYIITWFGVSAQFKRARGTWGTLAALPFAYIIQANCGNIALAIAAFITFVIGCWASEIYVRKTGKQDPGEIVIDEVAAIFLLLAFLYPTWQSYVVAFFIFRAFDVVKPWPVSVADRKIKGGFGVMFDDILAALYPVLLFIIIASFAPGYGESILSWLKGTHV